MYNDPNCKPWTSRTWAPPVGYSSRLDFMLQKKTTFDSGSGSFENAKSIKDSENERVGVRISVTGIGNEVTNGMEIIGAAGGDIYVN